MVSEKRLTQERVRELFDYRPKDGALVRRVKTSSRATVGSIAGCPSKGYLQLVVDGKTYTVHRLIWMWHYGYMPENAIDHIDKNTINNKIENLREVSRVCNLRNSKQQDRTISGVKGVYWRKNDNSWCSKISINAKSIYLGSSTCKIEAACLRLAAEQAENWEGCDSNSPAFLIVSEYVNKNK